MHLRSTFLRTLDNFTSLFKLIDPQVNWMSSQISRPHVCNGAVFDPSFCACLVYILRQYIALVTESCRRGRGKCYLLFDKYLRVCRTPTKIPLLNIATNILFKKQTYRKRVVQRLCSSYGVLWETSGARVDWQWETTKRMEEVERGMEENLLWRRTPLNSLTRRYW